MSRTPVPSLKDRLDFQLSEWQSKLLGQSHAINAIWPYVRQMFSGLYPAGRPMGNFMLLGPTGVGKTRTVETLAEVLHGSKKTMVRIDCGEFQMEHEVAKLIGAPPGYLGHRETTPLLTQSKLNAAQSEKCSMTLVLFDEIEKAAPSMVRLLLGVLDQGKLKLGSNDTVNFERAMIFFTSNLGAQSLHDLESGKWQLGGGAGEKVSDGGGVEAVRSRSRAAYEKGFSPEFRNRIDEVVCYGQLGDEEKWGILKLVIEEQFLSIGFDSPSIWIEERAAQELIRRGTKTATGARELKRVVQREIMHPLSNVVIEEDLSPGLLARAAVNVSLEEGRVKVRVYEDGVGAEEEVQSWDKGWMRIGGVRVMQERG